MHRNTMVLDLRQRVQWQSQIIRDLKSERDALTQELGSRLYFVEAQLLKEQKHIEALLKEKDTYIRFQNLQIESLKCILQQVDNEYQNHSRRSYRRSKSTGPHHKYSVAVDEYMKQDGGVISRALPVIVQTNDAKNCTRSNCKHCRTKKQRMRSARSLPELNNVESESQCCDDCDVRRYVQTSDLDSEHSDSLDSGISSPSIKTRNMLNHDKDLQQLQEGISKGFCYFQDGNGLCNLQDCISKGLGNLQDGKRLCNLQDCISKGICNLQEGKGLCNLQDCISKGFCNSQQDKSNQIYILEDKSRGLHQVPKDHVKSVEDVRVKASPRRSSSIGSFFNRKFSTLSQDSEKTDSGGARRHSSFSEIEMNGEIQQRKAKPFISSANKTFGTNHRSVTKPRDIKFRKLFKFRRREQSVDTDTVQRNDFISV